MVKRVFTCLFVTFAMIMTYKHSLFIESVCYENMSEYKVIQFRMS